MQNSPLLLVALTLPFLGSLIAAFLPQRARDLASSSAGILALIAAGLLATHYGEISQGEKLRYVTEWLPSLGLTFSLRLDGFTWLFSTMVLGIGALVILYARYYMSTEDPVPRFFAFFQAFMGSMLGLVLSGNLIQLAFFWELTSIFSFLLIGYWHHNQAARDGARMALIVTGFGGVCLLVGFLLLGRITGSYDVDTVIASGNIIRAHDAYLPALLFILLGAFTKSAQFPFHFWLPHAMAAPTPVSAYLHSATMVKAGIFLLILLWPALSGTTEWYVIVTLAGLATLVGGAWSAIFQQDLKGLLAYSTISHLGLITLLLGLSSPLAAVAAIFHTINHATFKASLFMATGIIDHETGTRDLRLLSGLARYMPITATLAVVAAAAMAGVPLLNGFISKEMFLAEALGAQSGTIIDIFLPFFATLASAFSVFYSIRFIHQTFFGPEPTKMPKRPHEAPHWMRLPIEILVVLCLLVGVLPAITIGPALRMAASSALGEQNPSFSLAIWHGFNLPLLMSFIALAGGAIAYKKFGARLNAVEESPVIGRIKARRTFEAVLAAIVETARTLHLLFGTRKLQVQLRVMIATALVMGLMPFIFWGYSRGTEPDTLIDPIFALIWVIGGLCAIGAAWQAKFHRLVALVLLGGAGLATCISFIWLSAPDLALTQLLVEIVTTVLLLLSLRWLPQRKPDIWEGARSPFTVRLRRGGDLILAISGGVAMALLSYAMMTRPVADTISDYFIENAYTGGGGTNVVNVMLVDFRSFDTLGEITVLAIVALTIFTLLRRFRPAPESVERPQQQRRQQKYDIDNEYRKEGDTLLHYLFVPRTIMQWLFPIIITLSLYLLIRGHDLPGGGFAGGITASVGILLLYMAGGTRWVEARLNIQPVRWISVGLLSAVFTGLAAIVFGKSFLKTYFDYLTVPIIGDIPIASALIFDIGVYSVVVGTTVLMLIAIAHQSIRSPRMKKAPEEPKQNQGGEA